VNTGLILWPLRIALSGKQFTPGGGVELADALGREESLRRIRAGIELLEEKISC
jgi:glutamyl-tRNA synthetase